MTVLLRTSSNNLAKLSLITNASAASNTHVVDLPYRLSSWAFDYPDKIRLWEQDGRLVAWAALQVPFWHIDYACDPAV